MRRVGLVAEGRLAGPQITGKTAGSASRRVAGSGAPCPGKTVCCDGRVAKTAMLRIHA